MNSDCTFEPVTESDLPLLQRWLNEPHWRQWWGDPVVELGYIRDMIEGRDSTRPYIFHIAGEPLGYIQVWFIGHHQSEDWLASNPWLGELPPETVGVDLSIGPPEALSRGIGTHVLSTFVAMLKVEGHQTIIIDPDPANVRAVRSYQKAGFVPIGERWTDDGPILLMAHGAPLR